MRNILILLIITLFLLIVPTVFAQDYAVTMRGDTVKGNIKMFNYGPDKKIQVVDADKKKTSFRILQIKSFTSDNELYHTVKGPQGYVFMKPVIEGYLSLYKYQLEKQVTYDGELLTKRDGTYLEVPNLNFKKAIKKYIEDCPGTVGKIDDGTLGKGDLDKIVRDYNECVEANTTARASTIVKAEPTLPASSTTWDSLEQSVKDKPDFSSKADALEMIGEVKNKLRRQEKVPNFLIEGVKNALKDAGVDAELEAALQEIK